MESVLLDQRKEIIRALRTRGYRLSPQQQLEVVMGEGLAVVVRIAAVGESVVPVGMRLAREFFTQEAFEQVIGKHPLMRSLIDRLHRLMNSNRWTVAEFLENPTTTIKELSSRDWQPEHIALLRRFLAAHHLELKEA